MCFNMEEANQYYVTLQLHFKMGSEMWMWRAKHMSFPTSFATNAQSNHRIAMDDITAFTTSYLR